MLETVGSTNAEAMARARDGARAPLWITATAQSAGRGRQGRIWLSPPGNLYASLLLTDPAPPNQAAELSFVAALALHDALLECVPALTDGLALKWPNDLLLNGGKLAGILIEAEGGGAKPLSVVIGFGVNCVWHPDDAPYPAVDLAAAGVALPPHLLFEVLAAAMTRRVAQWACGANFAAIRRDWLHFAWGVGAPIRVCTGKRDVVGVFADLDPHGRIVVTLPGGASETVSAGEVFPIEPAFA
jgi:BirA family biotin operon repressor/biotin-[acetyl-CoA-carboxylase] ligase